MITRNKWMVPYLFRAMLAMMSVITSISLFTLSAFVDQKSAWCAFSGMGGLAAMLGTIILIGALLIDLYDAIKKWSQE